MKRNPFYLLLLAGLVILTNLTIAQKNNYITSRYDFIPGEKVIFFDDFTSESIGDFPAQWLTNGSGEIVTLEKFPGKWLHITKMGYFIPEAKEDFTENFTIEFDFVPMTTDNYEYMYSFTFYLLTGSLSEPGGGGEPGDEGFQIYLDNLNIFWKNWSMQNGQRLDGMVAFPFRQNEKYHVALWVQKQRVRLYANENKVLDVPRAIPTGSIPNIFRFESDNVSIPLIGNFRIAAGLPDMRNKLLKDGKIISYGIQFDVNSNELKPESYSTLKMISDILKENPTIRLQIAGHTDSDGDDASNLELSKRRGASVKNELVSKFACEAARLETDGKGESEPIADNNSAVNKAKNRRVEFITIKDNASTAAIATSSSIGALNKETGSVKDPRDGKTYKTVKIGTQTWMAENLAFKTDSGFFVFDKKENNLTTYGYLYNWNAATKACPTGWHLPADAEWSTLTFYLAGEKGTMDNATNTASKSSPNTANKLRSTILWEEDTEATNETGFTALPGGDYKPDGSISILGFYGFWWSSTEYFGSPNYAWYRDIYCKDSRVGRAIHPKETGLSVRCLKD